jgi:mono/diheme cytochrome c family protein
VRRPNKLLLVRSGAAIGVPVLLAVVGIAAPHASRPAAPHTFVATIQPFLVKNCHTCHNAKLTTAGLNLEAYTDANSLQNDRDRWELILSKIQSGEMPPAGAMRPDAKELKTVTEWIQAEFKRQDKQIKPDPGQVTARRLNRAEYNNTIRDLLGVNFRAADNFPLDDSGYGFDNIGDVLSVSPVLMEKYLSAAEKISRIAIYGEEAPKPVFVHYQPRLRRPPPPPSLFEYDQTGLSLPSVINELHQFPADAEYLLKITLNGARPPASDPVTLAVWVDGKQIQQFTIERSDMEGESRSFRTRIAKGEHLMSVSFLSQFEGLPARFKGPNPSKRPDPAARRVAPGPLPPGTSLAGRVEALDIGGPFDPAPSPPTETLRRILTCGHLDGKHTAACPRKNYFRAGPSRLSPSRNRAGYRCAPRALLEGAQQRRFLR